MNSKYFIFLCIYLFSFINVNAASFDCSKATTAQEKTICNTPSLSSLDEKLAKIYKEAMANALDPQALKNEQRAWLKETRSCNAVPACLERSYETRISLLLPKKSDVQHQSQPEPHKEKQFNAETERLNAEQKKLAAEQRAKQIAEENERRKKWEESPEGKKALAQKIEEQKIIEKKKDLERNGNEYARCHSVLLMVSVEIINLDPKISNNYLTIAKEFAYQADKQIGLNARKSIAQNESSILWDLKKSYNQENFQKILIPKFDSCMKLAKKL